VPPGHTDMSWLRELTARGAAVRYPVTHPHYEQAMRQLAYELGVIETLNFPGYFLLLVDIVQFCATNDIYCQGRGSAANSAVCYALGVTKADAVALGLLFGYWKTAAAVFEPIMVALNSLPRITVAPLLILWFGLGMTSKVLLSLFTVFFVIFFNTLIGVRSVDPELVKAVKVMGGGPRHVARMVVVPSVCSWIFAALRTSVSFALTAVLALGFAAFLGGCASEPESHVVSSPPPGPPAVVAAQPAPAPAGRDRRTVRAVTRPGRPGRRAS